MREFSPGIEELGKSINRLEECLQHCNYWGSQRTSQSPLFHLTGFYLIHQLTSNTKQISLQIAQAVMWKWALHLACNYGMGLQFYYYLLFKNAAKGRSWDKTLGLMLSNDTCFNEKRELSKMYVLCPETLTSLSPEFLMTSLIIFGISQVQDHATITIMQSVEKLFVFSSFLSRRQVVTTFLKRNAKDVFQKQ